MDGATATVSGLGNTTTAYDGFATTGKAATEEQLKEIAKVADNANQGWNLSTNGNAASKVAPGETVDFSGDKNISVSNNGKDVKVKLNKDLDVDSVQTNVLNAKYNLSVGTANENGTMPFFVNSNGAFYAANGNLVVDKDGKVTATEGEIGNVVLKNGVLYKNTALRDGELYVGDADGNYSQITPKSAKLGQVTIDEKGNIAGVNSVQTNALNAKYNLSVGTANENGTVPFFVNSNGAFYAANGKLVVDKDGKVTATEGEIGNVVLKNGVLYKNTALRDGELYVGDASGNYSQITTKGAKLGKVTIAADGKIHGVTAGTADTDAVNVSQLKAVGATANMGWNLSTNGVATEATNVKPGDFVDFSGDKNISVKHDGAKVQVELNKDIDVNSVQTNALNAKYNLSVGTANANGIMPFFVNSTGAFYAANNNFSVDKDGKVTATAGEIGNVVLNNGVYTGNSALRDGELYVGDASGNYSQITTKGAKLGKVTIDEQGNIAGANHIQTNALNAKYNLSVGTANANGIMPFFVNSNGAFYAANNNFSVDKDGKVIATAGEIGNVVLNNGVFTGHSALRDGELYLGDASGNYSQITTTGAKLGQVTIAADGKISGVAAGEADTDAVNVSQLKKVSDTANAGWNLSTNGVATEATNVKPGDYVDFSGDKNISVSHDGTKVQVELNKNIDVNYVQTNALNSKYNLSVGTMAENGIMPFLVNSTGAFYAANNNFSVDKYGKVIATAGEIGNVVLQNGVYTGNSALRDGELYLGDASGNYSQITPKSAKLGQVTIDEKGNMAGVNSIQTNALNAKYNLSVGTMAENGIMPFLVNSTGAFYAANNNFSVDKYGKVIATAGEIGNVVLQNGVYTGNSALRDGELYVGDASGNYSQITTTGAKLGQVTIAADGKISGVAAGEVSSTSTDAINGSQLYQTNENVAQNKADIAQNKADIAQNKADIAQNKADIAQNKADIAQNKADIAQNKADIAQNKADIAQNKADIAQNKADIAQNKADIATNKADIATNKANIAQNAADIKNVEALAKKHTTVAAGDNITVSDVGPNAEGGKEYKVALKNIIDLGDKGSVTTGQTVMDKDGLKVGDKVSVSATAVTAGKTSISDEGVKVGDKTYISADGLNANGQHITNVKAGEADTDAVNYGQLKDTNNRINQLGNRVNKVGAGAAALAALHPMDFDPDDKLTFSAGYGNYGGENAAAIGAYYRPDEKVMFSVAGTVGNGENMVNAGVSFALDRTNHVSNSRTALAREVIDLRGQLAVMGAKMAKMEKAFGMLDETKTKLFPDVPANHWAYEYIAKLAGNGYIEGYPDGNFGGDRLMTRYEFAAMLYRAIEKGAALEEKIIKEFEPELGRIRVDRISGEDGDRDKIERVRVNDTKGERDHYGNKLAK